MLPAVAFRCNGLSLSRRLCCRCESGFEIVNDVVLNQVLVRYADGPTTARLMAALQADGRVWCGGTQWGGEAAMRISVSSWKTDREAAVRAADAIVEVARSLG